MWLFCCIQKCWQLHRNERKLNCFTLHIAVLPCIIPIYYPTLAREFQGFRVWGKFVFQTLELMATPTNLANQVKVGRVLDQSCSVQLRGPDRAHHNNAQLWWLSRQIADFRDSFERIKWLYLLFKCGRKTKPHFQWVLWHWIFTVSSTKTHLA